MWLLLAEDAYVKKYKAAFPRPMKRPGIYSATIAKTTKEIVQAEDEATRKNKQEDWVLYDVVDQETLKFFAWAAPETYLSAFYEEPPLCITGVTAMVILKHLQKNGAGNYEINILTLKDAMRQYHHTYDIIAKYIEAIELAQK